MVWGGVTANAKTPLVFIDENVRIDAKFYRDEILRKVLGHLESHHKCTSQSYCVSVKSRNGLVQRSCDGNSMAHISLCALSPVRRRVTNGDFIYGSSGAPNHHQTRNGRHQQLDTNCFNGGDLGEVCCCSTDFCNSTSSARWIAVIAVLILFLG
ncbi:hypothetical protein Y032_0165g13 [Ancylostoma ceylanicum]|nr:hypothetical protein Y032_0165g13 [Ancylostoma ceylanicum]